jgi:hypothetical protein
MNLILMKYNFYPASKWLILCHKMLFSVLDDGIFALENDESLAILRFIYCGI